MPMASCEHNGNNETKIGFSHSLAITFSDNSGNEIEITNSHQIIDIWIPRELKMPVSKAQYVNITKENNSTRTGKQLFPISFNISTSNASIHLEISPVNNSVGYIMLIKFGMTPRINSTFQDYDNWALFCPSGLLGINLQLFQRIKIKF